MSKLKIIAIMSVLISLILIAPAAFALDSQSLNDTDIIKNEFYFDSDVENDSGDGSFYNPYKELIPDRIMDNSVIYIENGEYDFSSQKIINNVSVIGENPDRTIIKNGVFNVSTSFSLKNITLLNCYIQNNGQFNGTNVIFKDSSSQIGSVICSYSSSSTNLINCDFINNHGSDYAGAIYTCNSTLTISDSNFDANYASNWGGAIVGDENSLLTITDTLFNSNYAIDNAGGAIYLMNSKLIANNLSIINSQASFGSAITALHSNLYLTKFSSRNNRAKYEGGSIYLMNGDIEISDSYFENNSARNGGALFLDEVINCTIASNIFINNQAVNTAGSCYILSKNALTHVQDESYNNIFYNNTANEDVYETQMPNLNIGDGNYILVQYTSSFNGTLPVSYDLRELNQVTSVKNQLIGGNCWAFASLAALESCILKASGESYDLSEENMKNLMELYSDYGWNLDTNEGGFGEMGEAYLVSWLGPVNESEDSYNDHSVLSPLLHSFLHVQNIIFLKRDNFTDNDAIKKALIDYGAVATSIYWGFNAYIKNNNNYYYSGSNGPNHAITIVGWDDNYSRDNFKSTPAGDGAWICKNSWGTGGGDGGYYYVSYYDTSLCQVGVKESAYTFILNNTMKYDKNYQYDIAGKTAYFYNTSDHIWYKNKFISTDDEYLAAVSTYFEKSSGYELYVYVNGLLKSQKSGRSDAGYYTIDLDNLIELNKDDIFEVVFKITVDGDVGVPISQKYALNKVIYAANESFVSYDGINWSDFSTLKSRYNSTGLYMVYTSQVACIKAFTVLNDIDTTVDLELDIAGQYADVIARVYNQYGFLVKNGSITFNIGGVKYAADIINGIAKFEKALINDGINNFSAEFSASGYTSSCSYVLVSKKPITTKIVLREIDSGCNPVEIRASVFDENDNPVGSGEVTFNIENANYTVKVSKGIAEMEYYFQKGGLQTVKAYYNDLYCYKASTNQDTCNVSLSQTITTLTVDGHYNPVLFTASVCDVNGNLVKSGNVTFVFPSTNEEYTLDLVNGTITLNHIFTKLGYREVIVYYNDLYRYESSETSYILHVDYKPCDITIDFENNSNPVSIKANLNSDAEGVVVFTVENTELEAEIVNGTASIVYSFQNSGLNDVSAYYSGSYIYTSAAAKSQVNVSKLPVSIDVDIENNLNSLTFNVVLSEKVNEYVGLYVNDYYMTARASDGEVSFSLDNLQAGSYSLRAALTGYAYDVKDYVGTYFLEDYSTSLSSEVVNDYCNNVVYNVKLIDAKSNALSGESITVNAGGQNYTAVTDNSGIAQFSLKLASGIHDINVTYKGSSNYLESFKTQTLNVKSTIILPETPTFTYNSQYSGVLLDKNGNPVSNRQFTITAGSSVFTAASDAEGKFSLTLELDEGSYNLRISNPLSGETITQNISVVSRICENKKVTMYYGAGKSYKVKVLDDNGNAAAGVKVTFKVNSKKYTKTTDANGYASFKITLNPGTYTITAGYKGYSVQNRITVKSTVVTKNMAVKKGKTLKFTAKLLNSKGKVLKNKKITFKFKGKTYKVKTNSKGAATLKLKMKYNVGKYVIASIYGKLKIKNTIKVKK